MKYDYYGNGHERSDSDISNNLFKIMWNNECKSIQSMKIGIFYNAE